MKTIETLIYCPACKKKHTLDNIKTVGKRNNSTLIHACCSACGMSSLALLARAEEGKNLLVMGMPTDLTYDETAKLFRSNPINADEVLDIYEKINHY